MKGKTSPKVIKPAGVPVQRRTNPPHRILVVNRNGDLRQLSTEVLIRSGYEAHAAADGATAWKALSSTPYDLLITDHDLSNLSGVRLLKKQRAARRAVPVILTSVTLPKGEFIQHPWLQPAATLLLPYTIDDLLGTVKEVLRATNTPPDAGSIGTKLT